jgi:hypothetical protein
MQESRMLIRSAGDSQGATMVSGAPHAETRRNEMSGSPQTSNLADQTQPQICGSLRNQINKWVALSVSRSVQLMRCVGAEVECVSADLKSDTHSITIFFFRHPDGNWQVYPPQRNRPAMRSCAMPEHSTVGL